jgi:hypothetical protein
MRIEQADPADTRKARECHEVYLAAQRVDEPGGPWFTDQAFGGWLAIGGTRTIRAGDISCTPS